MPFGTTFRSGNLGITILFYTLLGLVSLERHCPSSFYKLSRRHLHSLIPFKRYAEITNMVALMTSFPSPFAHVMSNVELGDYLIAILDINNGSLKAVNSPPSKWMFVGMTQHRPSSFEGSDAGKCEFCPLKILMQVERLAKPSHSTSRPSWDKTTRISRTAWEYQKS
jgi:hypothetical protein